MEPVPDPREESDRDRHLVGLALALARRAEAAGEVPVGAVLVRVDEVLGEGLAVDAQAVVARQGGVADEVGALAALGERHRERGG